MRLRESYPVIKPFNPLDKSNLAESIADAATNSEVQMLPPSPFIGAGVYMLYYTGDHPAYRMLVEHNSDGKYAYPIYVGKAVPAGARKGGFSLDVDHGTALLNRLTEHSESIMATDNLDICDFRCRFLVVDDIWIPLAESLLIEKYLPVWNRALDGFGNHDPGKGRHSGRMPLWDCMHPGREWASKLQPCIYTQDELERRVASYLEEFFMDK